MKHLNPRQGITTSLQSTGTLRNNQNRCETPKSPPGDYNDNVRYRGYFRLNLARCETPKSPPGDYNYIRLRNAGSNPLRPCVKHLNPRQGITTPAVPRRRPAAPRECVKHLNPRQGITTHSVVDARQPQRLRRSVKHLNPRQGITTDLFPLRALKRVYEV